MSDRSKSKPVAVVLHRITLREGADRDAFERCVLEEVFPAVATSKDDEAPDQHVLLNGGDRDAYVWMARLEYFVHHTPLPTWLSNRAEKMQQDAGGKLAAFSTLAPPDIYYDVVGWRRRLGK